MKITPRHFRSAYRMIIESFLDLWRGGWSNYVVISILAASLAIFGFILQFTFGLNFIGHKLTDQMEFSVYLTNDVQLKDFAVEVGRLPYVKRVEVIDKEIAWQEFKENFTISEEFLNPLPNTIHVRVSDPMKLKDTIKKVRNLPGVIDINYAPGVLKFINRLTLILQSVGFTITLILALVTVVITGNTIHLVITSRHNEIEILRLMGVEDWYIKGPLVLQGIIYSVIAATIAIIPLSFFQSYITGSAHKILGGMLPTGLPEYFLGNISQIYIILLIVGAVVTTSGCIWSMRKYLRI